jgi:hypothetical protein
VYYVIVKGKVYLNCPLFSGIPRLLTTSDDRGSVGALKSLNKLLLVYNVVADAFHIVSHSVTTAGLLVEVQSRPTQLTLQF